jgi:hypothetical protein
MRANHEISWILEGRSPDQIPMARLAEYLQQLSVIFGETESVHFDRVEKACTRVVAKLAPGAPAQRVQSRVYALRDRRAPADATRAFGRVNEMVGEDKGSARITFGAAVVLRFPGKKPQEVTQPFNLVDSATITGKLYALSEDNYGNIRARIRPRGGASYIQCTADQGIVGKLRSCFAETVRIQGRGKWTRAVNGEWSCWDLHVQDVKIVKDTSLREAIDRIREVEAVWPDDPLEEWAALDERDGAA